METNIMRRNEDGDHVFVLQLCLKESWRAAFPPLPSVPNKVMPSSTSPFE